MVVVSCAEPENSARGRSWQGFYQFFLFLFLFFQPTTYFTEGHTYLPREAIGPEGSNCFSSGVRTSISKETYSFVILRFSRGWGSGHTHTPDHERLLRVLRRRLYMRYLFQARSIGPCRSAGTSFNSPCDPPLLCTDSVSE